MFIRTYGNFTNFGVNFDTLRCWPTERGVIAIWAALADCGTVIAVGQGVHNLSKNYNYHRETEKDVCYIH